MKNLKLFLVFMLYASNNYAFSTEINQEHYFLTSISFFGLGILLAFTPCVLPMVPILSSILLGEKMPSNKKRSFQVALSFVLGMALVYTFAGLIAGYLGSTLQTLMQKPSAIMIFSGIFVLMAFSMFGFYELQLPAFLRQRAQKLNERPTTSSLLAVAIMGGLSTLIASPCITAPMVSILAFITQKGYTVFGGFLLFTLAMGMGLPLILFAIGQGALLPRTGAWMVTIKQLLGVMMLGLTIYLLQRVLSPSIILFLSSLLLIVTSSWMGAFKVDHQAATDRIRQGFCVAALIYGILLLLGAISGATELTAPLDPFLSRGEPTKHPQSLFHVVNHPKDFDELLSKAKRAHQPIMIEFYAAWCPDCREFDRQVLSDPHVQKLMQNFFAIRVDITKDSEALKALRKRYMVFGVPSMIFFDKNGKEVKDGRNETLNKAFLEQKLNQLS